MAEHVIFRLLDDEEVKAHAMIARSGQDNSALWTHRHGNLGFSFSYVTDKSEHVGWSIIYSEQGGYV